MPIDPGMPDPHENPFGLCKDLPLRFRAERADALDQNFAFLDPLNPRSVSQGLVQRRGAAIANRKTSGRPASPLDGIRSSEHLVPDP